MRSEEYYPEGDIDFRLFENWVLPWARIQINLDSPPQLPSVEDKLTLFSNVTEVGTEYHFVQSTWQSRNILK